MAAMKTTLAAENAEIISMRKRPRKQLYPQKALPADPYPGYVISGGIRNVWQAELDL
jgi:hypothetical protein